MTASGEQHVKSFDAELARLDAAARIAPEDPASALRSLPWLVASIHADARAGRFAHWGRSRAIDENTGTATVPRPLFDELHRAAGLAGRFPDGNAGLLHVYGYLLSTEPTPYGLKRERWLDGTLAQAYDLPPVAFLPWSRATPGTLLDRVTRAADRLLDEHPRRTQDWGGAVATIAIGAGTPAALACSLTRHGERRIITTFPVSDPEAVLAALDAEPPRPRWNAAPDEG
ncbi:amino acid deaminase [Microbacterium sp. SORGH_AS_0888]|uniref:amino acid deaminase n=1 Tax=Microbacterium sp. SORGH_AS_0888 TaxID=3041791 RepID=UPI0027D77D2A|nr:amino acid deaminase [Microbacterium sp. SORGH_AS_0888]